MLIYLVSVFITHFTVLLIFTKKLTKKMSSVFQGFENNFVDDCQQLYGMLVVLGLVFKLYI